MISFKFGSAVYVDDYRGHWHPECNWIVQPEEPIEAEFVQGLLDKYAPHVEAYAVTPSLGGFCIELQFHDHDIGVQCNHEYIEGWRKGGQVVTKKKAANKKATKRLFRHRMYILPGGTEFFYFAKGDGHGNLVGKVLTDLGFVADDDGCLPLMNKIVHRSVVEQGTLVPLGEERFWIGERPSNH